jgi:GTP cyclohydrolase I
MDKLQLTLAQVDNLARDAARKIIIPADRPARVFAIPRGGIPAAYAIRQHRYFDFVDHPADADYIVDDLIDSGKTMERVIRLANEARNTYEDSGPTPVVLLDKQRDPSIPWIVFPWEGDAVGSFEDNVLRMLQFIGEDPTRGGLLETPARVAKAWEFWASGYVKDPADILKVFEDGAEGCDEMVLVKGIPFYTHCEHHLAPFFGRATVAYIPDGRIVGLSKINRLVDCFARRLQVQERLTTQIADAINEHLKPKGVGVLIEARHLCMESRGVCQQGHTTTTSALRGVMLEGPVRQEFLNLAK